ncbi:MAG: ferredoxin-thioredoxin reductase catalytic domain-containing protein [Candidatus Hadarchaeota archaeon]
MDEAELKEIMKKYAASQGFKLNPDEEVTGAVIKGLLTNVEKYGFRYCPCRPVIGDRKANTLNICPCAWHKDEIRKMGHCHCWLFVKGK